MAAPLARNPGTPDIEPEVAIWRTTGPPKDGGRTLGGWGGVGLDLRILDQASF